MKWVFDDDAYGRWVAALEGAALFHALKLPSVEINVNPEGLFIVSAFGVDRAHSCTTLREAQSAAKDFVATLLQDAINILGLT